MPPKSDACITCRNRGKGVKKCVPPIDKATACYECRRQGIKCQLGYGQPRSKRDTNKQYLRKCRNKRTEHRRLLRSCQNSEQVGLLDLDAITDSPPPQPQPNASGHPIGHESIAQRSGQMVGQTLAVPFDHRRRSSSITSSNTAASCVSAQSSLEFSPIGSSPPQFPPSSPHSPSVSPQNTHPTSEEGRYLHAPNGAPYLPQSPSCGAISTESSRGPSQTPMFPYRDPPTYQTPSPYLPGSYVQGQFPPSHYHPSNGRSSSLAPHVGVPAPYMCNIDNSTQRGYVLNYVAQPNRGNFSHGGSTQSSSYGADQSFDRLRPFAHTSEANQSCPIDFYNQREPNANHHLSRETATTSVSQRQLFYNRIEFNQNNNDTYPSMTGVNETLPRYNSNDSYRNQGGQMGLAPNTSSITSELAYSLIPPSSTSIYLPDAQHPTGDQSSQEEDDLYELPPNHPPH